MTRKNDMTQEENNPLIPKLRFPEFRNAGGWRTVQLSEVLDYERPDRYIVNDTNYVNDGIPVLTANKSFVIGYTRETENVYTDVPVVIFDDFTTDKKLVTFAFKVKSSAIKILKAKKGDDLRLLYELMAQIKFDAQEHKRYYLSEYQYIKIPLPEINEQKKVAECLSTLDELIEAESRKLDALKDHKKGLMQQLFPREGETRPRLRFPEFQDAPGWESKTVDDLVDTITPPKKLLTSDYRPAGQFPVIDQSQDYICGWTDDEEAVIDDDLPVVVFGDHTCALKFVDRPFAQGADGIKILKAKADVRDDFLFYSLQANPVQQESYKRHFSTLRERVVAFPDKDSGEQRRIAACFSSLDDLIAAQSEKLKALRTHKRGLMQQLFPSPDAIDP